MNDPFEDELRRRLRPMDAPAGFAERVMRALPAESRPPVLVGATPPAVVSRAPFRRVGIPAALAASLLAAVLLGQHVAVERERLAEREGREASLALMQALRLTSKKLDIVYQAVQDPPAADAEENPS
jgi:hypothetical protein